MTNERKRYLIKVYDCNDFSQKWCEFQFNSMSADKIVGYCDDHYGIPDSARFDICQKNGDIIKSFNTSFIIDRFVILKEVK